MMGVLGLCELDFKSAIPFSLANASFCFFRSKRRVFAFRQGGFVGSGPAPGSREENEWNKIKLLVVITISVLKLKK